MRRTRHTKRIKKQIHIFLNVCMWSKDVFKEYTSSSNKFFYGEYKKSEEEPLKSTKSPRQTGECSIFLHFFSSSFCLTQQKIQKNGHLFLGPKKYQQQKMNTDETPPYSAASVSAERRKNTATSNGNFYRPIFFSLHCMKTESKKKQKMCVCVGQIK